MKGRGESLAAREEARIKIVGADDASRKALGAAKDAGVDVDPAKTPVLPGEERNAAAHRMATADAVKAQALTEQHAREAPVKAEKQLSARAERARATAAEGNARPAVSFRDRDAALKYSGGRVHAMRRGAEGEYDPDDVIIVENPNGESLVYVNPASPRYGEIAQRIHGGKLSDDGLHADHVASRTTENGMKQRYVLLGRVDGRVNMSHGRLERVNAQANRPFNLAARGDGVALGNVAMGGKLNGVKGGGLVHPSADGNTTFGTDAARHARFADSTSQTAIQSLKGRKLADPERASPARERLNKAIAPWSPAPEKGRDHSKI